MTVKLPVPHTLDECLHPRTLRLLLRKLPVELRMRVSVDPIFGRPVHLPFIAIIEPMIV